MSATMQVRERIGSGDEITIGSRLHLLGTDAHSPQTDAGWRAAVLHTATPRSYERWIRMQFTGTFGSVGLFRFWASNLVIPAGWSVKWGHTSTYVPPTNASSSIAVSAVPTTPPGAANCGLPFLPGTGTQHSEWIVVQAMVTDFSLITPGALMASTGTEIATPTLIEFDFGWFES